MPRDVYTPTGQLAGDLIREEMERRGWKQARLEERTSLSRAGLFRALKGADNVGGLVLRPIERELELPTYLLTWVRNGDVERVKAVTDPRLRPDVKDWLVRELSALRQGGRRASDVTNRRRRAT
jgi:transcriptional regulator with XRE-family HTH domain